MKNKFITAVEESGLIEDSAAGAATLSQRVTQLEEWVRQLRAEVDSLKGGTRPAQDSLTGE